MSDIRQFPDRFAGRVPSEKVEPPVRAIGTARTDLPTHRGYPAPIPVAATASKQVVNALAFYARGGFDHGEAARLALTGMTTALEANQTT